MHLKRHFVEGLVWRSDLVSALDFSANEMKWLVKKQVDNTELRLSRGVVPRQSASFTYFIKFVQCILDIHFKNILVDAD